MDGMNVKPATTNPQATQEINGMISMIQTLVDKGYAYPAADGTVYFRVKKFKEYGKLSHKNLDDLQSGFRSLQVSGERRSVGFRSLETEERGRTVMAFTMV